MIFTDVFNADPDSVGYDGTDCGDGGLQDSGDLSPADSDIDIDDDDSDEEIEVNDRGEMKKPPGQPKAREPDSDNDF